MPFIHPALDAWAAGHRAWAGQKRLPLTTPPCPWHSIAEMLECTSLMAFVGAGEQPSLTPRKLTLMNTTTQSVIQDLSFPSSVLAVRINRKRCVPLGPCWAAADCPSSAWGACSMRAWGLSSWHGACMETISMAGGLDARHGCGMLLVIMKHACSVGIEASVLFHAAGS